MTASQENLRGTLRFNEPMTRHTSWRVGGAAEKFYAPADIEDMAEYLRNMYGNDPKKFWKNFFRDIYI